MIELELRDRAVQRLFLGQELLQLSVARVGRSFLRLSKEGYHHRRNGEEDQQSADQVFHALSAPIP